MQQLLLFAPTDRGSWWQRNIRRKDGNPMKNLLLALFLSATACCAQSVPFPAGSLTLTGTATGAISGTITVTNANPITVPVTLPAATAAGQVLTATGAGTTYTAQTPSSGASLPSGITWTPATSTTPALLSVAGGITASGLLTGNGLADTAGPAVPTTCPNNLLVLQYTVSTGILTPVCPPPVTLTAVPAAGGGVTLTPSL